MREDNGEATADRIGDHARRDLGDHHGDSLEDADEDQLWWREFGDDDEVDGGDQPPSSTKGGMEQGPAQATTRVRLEWFTEILRAS